MIRVYIQNTHLKVFYSDASDNEIEASEIILKTKFSAHDSSMKMNPLVKRGIVSDIRSFYNEEFNILQSGFWKYLQYYYDQAKIQYEVVDMRVFPKIDKEFVRALMKDEISYTYTKDDEEITEIPRDYQRDAVIELIKQNGGICQLPTGSGKTLVLALLLHTYHKTNFIILFDSIDLIEQSYNDLMNYGFTSSDVGVIQGINNDLSKRITLLSMMSYEKAFGMFPRIKGIITDECHTTGRTDTAEKVILACQNCSLKIGLSATPWNDNDFQTMRLYGNIGPIIFKREIKEHIDENYLTDTRVEIYSYDCMPILIKGFWQDRYDNILIKSERQKERLQQEGYEIIIDEGHEVARKLVEYGDEYNHFVSNDIRNMLVVDIIKKYVKEKRRILVMFNRIEHGEIIKSMYPKALLIHGNNDLEERAAAQKYLTEHEGSVVVVSRIWAKGKNIPKADCLINISAGHASTAVIQKLGRITRLSQGKDDAIVVDIDDSCLSRIGRNQSEKRIHIYKRRLNLPIEYKSI